MLWYSLAIWNAWKFKYLVEGMMHGDREDQTYGKSTREVPTRNKLVKTTNPTVQEGSCMYIIMFNRIRVLCLLFELTRYPNGVDRHVMQSGDMLFSKPITAGEAPFSSACAQRKTNWTLYHTLDACLV